MSNNKNIILVSTGVFQDYILQNINQLLKLEFNIYVIVDRIFIDNLKGHNSSIKIIDADSLNTNFDSKSLLNKEFRNGFWNNTSKRLFLVYEYMKLTNLEDVIHLENDVLLYSNMKYKFEEKIYITMDSKKRCIPGIIYIPKYNLFTKLIQNYDFTNNDMINLALFYNNNKEIVKTFPIIDDSIGNCMYNENFQEFDSIFDGAAIGQYLGGVDPRNIPGDSTGFINETCEIKYDKYKFKWIKKGNYYFPFIEINDKLIAINNLHIHSKKLVNFTIEKPNENKFIKIKDDSLFSIPKLPEKEIKTYYFKESTIIKIANNEKLNFCIACYGGCDSNYINSILKSKYKFTNIYYQKLCHYIRPLKLEYLHGYLYIYRDPISAIISQFNRNIFGNFYKIKDEQHNHLDITFENLFYLMHKQLENFKNTDCNKILIKYETAYKYIRELHEIFGINFEFKKNVTNPDNIEQFMTKYNIDPNGENFRKVNKSYNEMPEFYSSLNMIQKDMIEKNINFITGEKIQFSCDHFVGTDKYFRYNPNVAQYKDRFIHIDKTLTIDNKILVFCYTHVLDNINNLIITLKAMQNKFNLLFHNSDHQFDNKHLILFEKLPLLQCIFTQNMNVNHKKVFPLPIGLANSQWRHGNSEIHQEIYYMPIKKTKEIYFNFDKNTNREKRNKCYNDIIQKGITWNEKLPYKEYLIELKRHKYSICPEGKGIDTHRFWECLYMNTIPICLKNITTIHYKQYFPIILLNDWQELDVSKLSYLEVDHQYLDMKFINQVINNYTIEKNNNLQKVESLGDSFFDKSISKNLFDIVIPVGPEDKSIIEKQIIFTKKNIIGYRNIFLICYDPSIIIDGCITINENIFPFNIDTVIKYHGKLNRNGWYLQQLLKLYAGKVIPNILDKYLVIDSDTFFLKPTNFVENNKCLYNYGTEYHRAYFAHMKKLDKDLTKIDMKKSGICHHMIFETKYLDEIISKIENNYNDKFYNIFLEMVTDIKGSGASEYEIYFNYMLKYYPDKIKIRKLDWKNIGKKLNTDLDLDYISYHWYGR